MAAPVPPLQVVINSDVELEKSLASKGLKVVELFSEWCGPCKSVVPTFRRIRIDKDDEAALQFLAVPAEKCSFLEVAKDHRGKSEPLFLLYRNGQLKGKIEGANTPTLSTQILQLTPANADMDDLEENPVYLAWQERERVARGEVAKAAGGKKGKK
mmetsp:Transcript_20330/g.51494  ORF Transcript_20330/g.51494 Transcript_20330/m.51494 type:complete len:156 (-) Transcript_20330:485-952(-)|eukprot:CAMPEP_0202868556 /NCGR_PEP_ID=MMETSP1391-20130828/10944_1 /ASSEMBLY_ACC=CAM_ASM_000867 /TAXON_ID=1034604 /ORGANISM="Chlamydomonas leiostraca, Strain SAG 11-49" /LENGTH=155 /DNA_ID=CAMNT_0049548741 /DNA_START=72 /DNA_END=539 /DNA_ORIENTATION=-